MGAALPLLAGDSGAVELDEVGQELDAVLSVERVLTDWVVPEPEHLQVGESTQVLQLLQVSDLILAQIQFLQLLAGLEVTQAADLVQRKRADLHVRQVSQG